MSETTKRIAQTLAQLRTDSSNPQLLKRAETELEQHGLEFFKAVVEHFPGVLVQPEKAIFDEAALPVGDQGATRHTWTNASDTQVVQPLQYFKPKTLNELVSIVQRARAEKITARAIGSGHSHSDVGATTGFLIDTHGLNRTLDLEPDLLKDSSEAPLLFKTECGITIRDLNADLDNAGLALANMGGYDGQTIIGAISTSTHGSGITLGPLSSQVVSLVLVTSQGKLFQIEPANGVTDPDRFRRAHPEIELKQDDDWFQATVVSMGCFGVIYSVTIRVMEKYWLSETRALSNWEQVRNDLEAGRVLTDNRHYEVLINPYVTDGRRNCLVTRRNPAPRPILPLFLRPNRQVLSELIAALPGASQGLQFLFNELTHLTPTVINWGLQQLVDEDYVNLSYKIFNLGTANNISAYSSEIAFPMNTYLDAVEKILELAEQGRVLGNVYHTSPIALRFVKQSDAYMSMQHGGDTCMVELPMVTGTIGGREILDRIERAMFQFGGRPHWGQVNRLTGSDNLIKSMYPKYDSWIAVFHELNSDGVFDSPFTYRCGFSRSLFGG
jgi:hypothetical protein